MIAEGSDLLQLLDRDLGRLVLPRFCRRAERAYSSLVGAANMPQAILAKLNADANRALAHPELRDKLRSQHYQPRGGTPDEFRALIRTEVENYGKVIWAVGIRPN